MISVQVLRCIAAVIVVIFHVSEKTRLTTGTGFFQIGVVGVDIFFVISGFIMMFVSSKNTNAKVFFLKRIERVVPVYWFYTTVALCVFLLFPSLINSNKAGTAIWQSYLLIPEQNESFLLQVAWTLSYEMVFYILFSVGLYFKFNPTRFLFIIIPLFVGVGKLSENYYMRVLFSPIIFEFLYGVIAYHIYIRVSLIKDKYIRVALPVVFIIFSLLCFSYFNYCDSSTYNEMVKVRFLHLGLPSLLFVISCMLLEPYFKASMLMRKLSYVGDSSYSLYLSHLFTINFVFIVIKYFGGEIDSIYSILLSVSASIIAGVFAYEIIEQRSIYLCVNKLKNGFKNSFPLKKYLL